MLIRFAKSFHRNPRKTVKLLTIEQCIDDAAARTDQQSPNRHAIRTRDWAGRPDSADQEPRLRPSTFLVTTPSSF